jgi:uncharacterized LabA/DUF88 family protein
VVSNPERVIVYVDGFNLYFGLRDKGWRKYYWLDIAKLARSLLTPNQILVRTKYFTSKITNPAGKTKRQQALLSALGTLPDFDIFFGRYQTFVQSCRRCGHRHLDSNEKRTDVNIATQMLVDAFQDAFDTAILISADSDLTAPVLEINQLFPSLLVKVAFPAGRFSLELESVARVSFQIYEGKLRKSLLPDRVTLPSGYVVERPASWY